MEIASHRTYPEAVLGADPGVTQRRVKWTVSVSGDCYAALQKRCNDMGLSVSSVVESFVADIGEPPTTIAEATAPRVAIDISESLLDRIDSYRRRAARQGVEISRSDALEDAILQAIESR